MKPKVLIDIRKKAGREIAGSRINLSVQKIVRMPVKAVSKWALVLFAVSTFIFGYAFAPTGASFVYVDVSRAAQNEEQRKILEAQLSDLENQIAQHEATIEQYQKQGSSLQSEIKKLNTQVSKLNLQIKVINLSLANLDNEIKNTQGKISDAEVSIGEGKQNLSSMIQSVYENDGDSLIEVLLKNPKLSDFFGDVNNLVALQDNLRTELQKIIETKQNLVDQKEVLALQKEDATALKAYQDEQRANIQETQSAKATLLVETKGKESVYQKLVAEKKKTAAQIRIQIFQLLGGGEMNFADAYQLAKAAEQATGVRAAFLLAILDRESALGKNVGKCDYKTAMNPKRDTPIFLQLISELGLQKNLDEGIIKVSCANADGAYGGAMGPAQFIPSTWALYKDRVASITGSNPPSPWSNADAFMATALYLKDAGAANATLAQEKIAAAKYYAGSRWRYYLSTYGARVIAQTENFQDDINVLNA
ncbi:MAG: lytic murein transglycosylase [Candidatus Wolfebacteria bacterium]|nr:lytic murein transglycosylase [Candidatus Wolfebacteria bacterium]